MSARRSVKGVDGVIVHRPRGLGRVVYRGIPVTPVGRTIVDVADVVGARALRAVLEQVEICREAGLPKPRMNGIIEGMEVDASWPELRLAVEIDSWKYHGTRTAQHRDRRRSAALQLAGWTLVRFTDVDIEHDRPYVKWTVGAFHVPQARR